MANDSIALRVGSEVFPGWKTIAVSRSVETLANSFELSIADVWQAGQRPWPIREGDECSVMLNGAPIVTGYVDTRAISFSASEHRFTVGGRDAAAKLVDCSCDLGAWQFIGMPLEVFLLKLGASFGVAIKAAPGVSLPKVPTEPFSINVGDTGFDVLDRVCRFAGVLPVSDGIGGITLISPTFAVPAPTALVEGMNVLSGDSSFSTAERFASYKVLGQSWESGGRAVSATATDPNVSPSSRSLIIQAEGSVSIEKARARAKWEASTRAARASKVTVTVQGWTENGYTWTPGNLVVCKLPTLGITGQMLITGTTMRLEKGSTTEITLSRPDAFAAELNPLEAWKN